MPEPALEEPGELSQQFVDEPRRRGLGDVDRALGGHTVRVTELERGIGGQHRAEMSRGVDLRDDRDVQPVREVQDLPDLGLGEMLLGDDLGMGGRLDTEALVVGEVQPEHIELEVGHLTQPVLDPPRGVVLARDVEVQPALRPAGTVPYDALGHHPVGAQRLLERAGAVEDTGLIGSGDPHPAAARGQGVRLGGAASAPEGQLDIGAGGGRTPVGDPQLLREQLPLVGETLAAAREDDTAAGGRLPAGAAGGLVLAYGGDTARRPGERERP